MSTAIQLLALWIAMAFGTLTHAVAQAETPASDTAARASADSSADISAKDAVAKLRSEDPPLFLDLRTAAEYEKAHIPGALNIPHDQLSERIDEIRAEGKGEVVFFCESGRRAALVEPELAASGSFRLYHLEGDMRGWREDGLPVVTGQARGE